MGKAFAPVVVLAATVALKTKVLLPLSEKGCVDEPPIALRLPVTT
jgi:hypothetical protein